MSWKRIEEEVWWTIGVDTGEERHRFVVVNEFGERQCGFWVGNRSDKIEEAVAKVVMMLPAGARLRLVTEGLRSLGWVVAQVASEFGLQVWQVGSNALNHYRRAEGQPRKDDDRDAYLAARMVVFGMEGCHLAVDPCPEERALCRLTRLRRQQLDRRTAVKARLRSRLVELAPEVISSEWSGPAHDGKGLRAVLRRWPTFDGLESARVTTVEKVLRSSTRYGTQCRKMAEALKAMARRVVIDEAEREILKLDLRMALDELDVLDQALAELEKELARRVESHPVGQKLLAMPGEGIVTVGTDLGEILPVARNVSEGSAATYAGLTPLSRISGKGGKGSKLARGVNKHAARTNYMAAIAATSASSIDAAFHRKQKDRHQGHPKPHVKATLSLARQRFKVKYKLMTTDAVYDKEILIASHLERLDRERRQASQTSAAGG